MNSPAKQASSYMIVERHKRLYSNRDQHVHDQKGKKEKKKVVQLKTSAVFSVVRGTGVKTLLAKSCQALWVSASCVRKQIAGLCSVLQKSNPHRSKRHAELAQRNFRNSLLLPFPCSKILSATAPPHSCIKWSHLYQVSARFPFGMSSSACTPRGQTWHPATKPTNFERSSGLPTSVTGSCAHKTERKKHGNMPNWGPGTERQE